MCFIWYTSRAKNKRLQNEKLYKKAFAWSNTFLGKILLLPSNKIGTNIKKNTYCNIIDNNKQLNKLFRLCMIPSCKNLK